MTEVAGYHRESASVDQQVALRTAATGLGEPFSARYEPEPIDQFATGSTVPNSLPLLAERGIDIAAEYPEPWTDEVVRAADVVVTMGCAVPVGRGRQ